jgi:hypothetical protein
MSDTYERFLTGHMTARRLMQEVGFEDLANSLVPVLHGLQNAHDRIVHNEAKRLVLGIIRASRAGKIKSGEISRKVLADTLGVSNREMRELERLFPNEAIAEGVRRIEDMACGRVKGLTEAEFRRDLRKKKKVHRQRL